MVAECTQYCRSVKWLKFMFVSLLSLGYYAMEIYIDGSMPVLYAVSFTAHIIVPSESHSFRNQSCNI